MLLFYLLCYAAVLINFAYYAQYYAHVKDLYFCYKLDHFIRVFTNKKFKMLTVLLEYINS